VLPLTAATVTFVVATILLAVFWPKLVFYLNNQTRLWKDAYRDWSEAERRAQALLRDLLNDAEYQQWMGHGYLEVASRKYSDRTYHISRCGGRVYVYESGRPVMRLCVQPAEPIPASEIVVLHKLMIEGDEERYLQAANRLVGRAIWA
jgi:hypothetical protein